MLDQVLDQLDPAVSTALFTVIMGSFGSLGWVGVVLRQILATKQAQASLHSALDSGVDWVTDKIAEMVVGQRHALSREQITDKIVDYVKGSVPGALKTLRKEATQEQLKKMAEGRLNMRLMELAPYQSQETRH